MAHNFQDSLKRSQEAEDLPFWGECYRKFFGEQFQAMHSHRRNGDHQHYGVDRSVTLTHSKQVLIDEKARFQPWQDIALEYVANNVKRTPGWVCKDLLCDYIAYAVVPLGRCYLLPVVPLQAAWRIHGEEWIRKANRDEPGFRIVPSPNRPDKGRPYHSLNVALPVNTLFAAIGSQHRIDFTPYTEAEPEEDWI